MKPCSLFRQDGSVIKTRASRRWFWPAFALVFLLSVFGLAGYWDAQAEQRHQRELAMHEAELLRTFEAGVRKGHADMVASARAAWQAATTERDQRCSRRQQ